MGKGSAPEAPDYTAAAKATAQGDLANAQIAQYQNMVNQYTPQGSVEYSPEITGYTDASGKQMSLSDYNRLKAQPRTRDVIDPFTGKKMNADGFKAEDWIPINKWSQTVKMSPVEQAAFDRNNAINAELGKVATQGVGYVQDALDKPLSYSDLQQIGSPQQLQQQASDAAYAHATRYMDPMFDRRQRMTDNQLSNMGITRGSEAWKEGQDDLARERDASYEQARNLAYGQGMQGASQLFNQSTGKRQQEINERQSLRQDPINMLNAVRTGQQMSVTNQPNVATSSPSSMATTGGADLMGAASAQHNAAMASYNAQQAGSSALTSGLMGLGNSALSGPIGGSLATKFIGPTGMKK